MTGTAIGTLPHVASMTFGPRAFKLLVTASDVSDGMFEASDALGTDEERFLTTVFRERRSIPVRLEDGERIASIACRVEHERSVKFVFWMSTPRGTGRQDHRA